jgi:phage tail-like protein
MAEDQGIPRRNVLKGAAVGGLTVAAATATLAADARTTSPGPPIQPPGRPPGSDVNVQTVFSLELETQNVGFFTECSGVGSESEVIEHKVVDKSGHEIVRKIPGRLKWTDITLKRGITSDLQIWAWREEVERGELSTARSNGSITEYDSGGQAIAKWQFQNGWPSKVVGGSAQGRADDCQTEVTSLEEVTIVVEGMYREL